VLVETEVERVVAQGVDGSFGLLPRHIDFTSVLPPGIMSYQETNGHRWYVAVDEGVLVKQGTRISVAARNAIKSRDLEQLVHLLDEELRDLDDRERKSRSVLAMLEGGIIKQFNEQTAREPG
jgi:F-type H+-transporting ATPase subunit epsilon